jgi:hypothetical protein
MISIKKENANLMMLSSDGAEDGCAKSRLSGQIEFVTSEE